MHFPPPLTLTLTSWPSFRGDDANSGCSIHALGSGGDDGGEAGAVRLGGLIWGTAVASGASVFVGSTNRRFCRVDVGQKNELTVAWTYTVPPERADTLIDSAASLSPDGRQVVVPGGDGRLHALDAATGALQWRFSAHSDGDSDASAALGGGGGVSDERHDSGVVVNSFEGNVRHSADGARVYAGCDNAAFYCVDAATGRQLWRFDTGMMIWTVAALMDGLVLFGSLDGTLYALDALDGRLVAKHVTGGEIKSSPLALDGSVFVCNSNGRVQRLALSVSARREHGGAAAATFEPVWAYEAGAEVYGSPALCAATGTLVVTDMLGGVAALDARDGSLRWRRETFGYVAGSPVVTADGVVVVGTSAGWLLALSVRDGVPVGALVLANGRVAPLVLSPDASRRSRPDRSKGIRTALNASPIVLPGGTVVVGSYDGHAYVVPGRRLLDALVDLPFALPTAVAGIALAGLYAPDGWIGHCLAPLGIQVSYTRLGVFVALLFIGLPFVVRSVQPVIEDLDPALEESAACLGATRGYTFCRVILPVLLPALAGGFAMAFARGIGEYGSVIFIAGNIPEVSEIVPLLIVARLEQYDYAGATALAVAMLAVSFVLLLAINLLQGWNRRRRGRD